MEKKLKHKKTGEIATYKDGVLKSGQCCVEIGKEPSSEIWEEVLEKDYEIKSFIGTKNHLEFEGRIVYKIRDKYYLESVNYDRISINNLSDEKILKTKRWEIHSIQRIIDGEIFSVGDYVKPYHFFNRAKIKKFEPEQDSVRFIFEDNTGILLKLFPKPNHIKKENFYFKTEDGVEIEENTLVYRVETYCDDDQSYIPIRDNLNYFNIYKVRDNPHEHVFSTLEAANEWIFQNKPVLSYNDVWKTLGQGKDSCANVCIFNIPLEHLVKSKL